MKIKEMCYLTMMSLLIGIGAFIKIPTPLVPITFQTLFVIIGALVFKKKIVYSLFLYLFLGLIGLPVFSQGGGLGYVFVPSFGYLVGFLFGGYFIGMFCERYNQIIVCLIGLLIVYGIGIGYFILLEAFYYHKIFTFSYLFMNMFLLFVPGDLISLYGALLIKKRISIKNLQ